MGRATRLEIKRLEICTPMLVYLGCKFSYLIALLKSEIASLVCVIMASFEHFFCEGPENSGSQKICTLFTSMGESPPLVCDLIEGMSLFSEKEASVILLLYLRFS